MSVVHTSSVLATEIFSFWKLPRNLFTYTLANSAGFRNTSRPSESMCSDGTPSGVIRRTPTNTDVTYKMIRFISHCCKKNTQGSKLALVRLSQTSDFSCGTSKIISDLSLGQVEQYPNSKNVIFTCVDILERARVQNALRHVQSFSLHVHVCALLQERWACFVWYH